MISYKIDELVFLYKKCGLNTMKLYQSYLGEGELKILSPLVIPWDIQNNTQNDTREYELFKNIASQNINEPWGLISQKFFHKSHLSVEDFYQFAEKKLGEGFDCAFVNPMIGNEALYINVWQQGAHCGHTGMDKIALFLENVLGLSLQAPMDKNTFAFSNYFIATPVFWNKYFSFVDNALGLLDREVLNGSEVGKIYSGSGSYRRNQDITMRPFVIERLFSTFIQNHDVKVASFVYEKQYYIEKFGDKFGKLLFQLSAVKNSHLKNSDKDLLSVFDQVRSFIYANTFYVSLVWNLDDPPEFFLSSEYEKFISANLTGLSPHELFEVPHD